MTRGLPLFLLICVLVVSLYAAPGPALKWAALAGLGFLYVLTALPSKASAGRSSGEAVSSDWERGD